MNWRRNRNATGLIAGRLLALLLMFAVPFGGAGAGDVVGSQAEIARLRAEIEALAERLREIEARGEALDGALADGAVELLAGTPLTADEVAADESAGGQRTATSAGWLMREARRARSRGDLESAELYFAAVIEAYEGEPIAARARADLLDLYRSHGASRRDVTAGGAVAALDDEQRRALAAEELDAEAPDAEVLNAEPSTAEAGGAPANAPATRSGDDDALVAEVLAELRRRRAGKLPGTDNVVDFGGGVSAPAGEAVTSAREVPRESAELVDGEALLRDALPVELRDDLEQAPDAPSATASRGADVAARDAGGSEPPGDLGGSQRVAGSGLARGLLGLGGDPADFGASVGDRVFFRPASSQVDLAAAGVLEAQARWISDYEPAHVTIEAHADEPGSDAENLDLSVARGQAVKQHLVELGVAEALIDVIAFGRTEPVAQCDREICARQNRRAVTVVGPARARPGRVSHERKGEADGGGTGVAGARPAAGAIRVSRIEPTQPGPGEAATIVESGERSARAQPIPVPRSEPEPARERSASAKPQVPVVVLPVRRQPRDISEALRQLDLSTQR